MEGFSGSDGDPFVISAENPLDRYLLSIYIDVRLANDPDLKRLVSTKSWGQTRTTHNTRDRNVAASRLRGFKMRVVLAAIGAAFLLGPMWLMVLRPGVYTSLVAVTVFVSAFGIFMAWALNEGKDVLASTAAYAAVLVVFVGTNGP